VVRAAVALADAEGLDAVTIRAAAGRLGTGVMSLYSYVPDKQTLVYDMVEEVSSGISLPEPGADWRADLHLLAGEQRALLRRHPWLIEAASHLQPLGPGTLAVLEFALGALEPTGLPASARLETFALVKGSSSPWSGPKSPPPPLPPRPPPRWRDCRTCWPPGSTPGSPPPWPKAAPPPPTRPAQARPAQTRPPSSTGSWTGSWTA